MTETEIQINAEPAEANVIEEPAVPTEPLVNNWVMWFHRVDDERWDLNSYTELCTISDLEDFHAMFNTFFNLAEKMTANAGMFFLMREGVTPMWEDKKNRTGGMWSYKIPKREGNILKSDVVWRKIVAACVGMSLTKNPENMRYINGLSISPKLDNCIIKIWNNDCTKSSASIISDLEGLDNVKAIYKRACS